MGVERQIFGKNKEGKEITLYRISNSVGTQIAVTDLGANLVSVYFKDREGIKRDLVLGFEKGEDYLENGPHLGATVGRNGNRIENSCFMLNGEKIQLTPNEKMNNLHSGPEYYDHMMWDAKVLEQGVSFHRLSPDGEQGFPGNFDVTVTYTLKDDNSVEIHYEGVCDKDTAVNMTNHSYFNLAGHDSGKITKQILQLNAKEYTPFNENSIPTGEICSVEYTPLDFTEAKAIGKDIEAAGGYDHNFLINKEKGTFDWMAKAWCEETGIMMEAFTDCPAVQFYTANFLSDEKGKQGVVYQERNAFCLETQFCPDSVNKPMFEQPFLKAGEKYDSTTVYRFSLF